MKGFSIFFGVVSTILLIVCNPVWGHAAPTDYDPKPGAVVHTIKTISIIFDEELEPMFSTFTVFNEKKQKIATGSIDKSNSKKLILQITSLETGNYNVQWVAVALDDGHKTQGEYDFKVE